MKAAKRPLSPRRATSAKPAAFRKRTGARTPRPPARRLKKRADAASALLSHSENRSRQTSGFGVGGAKVASARGAPPLPARTEPLRLKIPPVLLEGDEPAKPAAEGPGQRFALGPSASAVPAAQEEEGLPEAYGTRRLALLARDPHCLHAHWDLTAEQQRHYNSLSAHQHLVVRVFVGAAAGPPALELHVHPESRHWFIHVERDGTQYVAELGYYQPNRKWVTLATSNPATTPRTAAAAGQPVQFMTIPAEAPLTGRPPARSERALPGPRSKQGAPAQTRASDLAGQVHAPPGAGVSAWEPGESLRSEWTPEQEQALAELLATPLVQQEWIDSVALAELARGEAGRSDQSVGAPTSSPFGGEMPGVSSPAGGEMPSPGGFWFKVNAELVVYGATEPGARVTIGGRDISLRPDGTFSCRFALPDGRYELPIAAVSAAGDARRAELKVSRGTVFQGEVGTQPPDPALKPPAAGP